MSLVVGCLGLAIAISGLVVFVGEMAHWLDSGEWRGLPMRWLLEDPVIGSFLRRTLLGWLNGPDDALGLHALANTVLDRTPAPVFLVALGGAVGWTALR